MIDFESEAIRIKLLFYYYYYYYYYKEVVLQTFEQIIPLSTNKILKKTFRSIM